MSRHIKRKKTHFIVVVSLLLVTIAGGMEFLKQGGRQAFIGAVQAMGYEREFEAVKGLSGEQAARREASARGIPVLLYHGITVESDRFSMTADTFKDQLFALKRAGWRTVGIDEFVAFMRGEIELPERSLLLTFDDGRMDSYRRADPLLELLDYRATMFIAAGQSIPGFWEKKSSYYISPVEVKDMVASGRWDLGSHAIQDAGGYVPVEAAGKQGNFLSSRMWREKEARPEDDAEFDARVAREMAVSRRAIEEKFGVRAATFSYPFGDYGNQGGEAAMTEPVVRKHVSENYALAFRQTWLGDAEYSINYRGDDPYRLKRVEVPTDWTGARLIAFLEGMQEKSLPFADDGGLNRGWRTVWGDMAQDDRGLVVAAKPGATGASIFLDGAEHWDDYAFTATVDWSKGSHVTLLARYRDAKNNLGCTFGERSVRIDHTVDGKTERLADVWRPTGLGHGRVTLTAVVHGGHVTCVANGVVRASSPAPQGTGGVGFKVWDERPENAEIAVRAVRAESPDAYLPQGAP